MIKLIEPAMKSLTNPVMRMLSDSPASATPAVLARSATSRKGEAMQLMKAVRAAAPSAASTAGGGTGAAAGTAAAAPAAATAAPPAGAPPAGAAAAGGATPDILKEGVGVAEPATYSQPSSQV